MAMLGPGEYVIRRKEMGSKWDGICFTKGLFAKRYVVKSLDKAFVEKNVEFGWDEVVVGHQLLTVEGKKVDHLSSAQLVCQLEQATELMLFDEKRGNLEVELMLSIRGSVHFMAQNELLERMTQATAFVLENKLDQAFNLLCCIPPGANLLRNVLLAEIQFIRALVSQDILCTQNAIEHAERAIDIASKFSNLPDQSPKRKLQYDIVLAESLALAGIAHLLQNNVNPAVTALGRSLVLYTQCNTQIMSSPLNIPQAIIDDIRGRSRFGLGVFYLFSAVVPPEYQWILQLLKVKADIHLGMSYLYESWTHCNLRSHWAGLALMNASPALLQHRLLKKYKKAQCEDRTSMTSNEDDSDEELDWTDLNVQRRTLDRIENECLQLYPSWVLFLWSSSVKWQWIDSQKALTLALQAEASFGHEERKYQLQLQIGHLSFQLFDHDRATTYFQRILTLNARTSAMAPPMTQIDASVYLASCYALEGNEAIKTARALLRRALSLRQDTNDEDIVFLLDRAAYYSALPNTHLPLLAFDLVCLNSKQRVIKNASIAQEWFNRHCANLLGTWMPPSTSLPIDQPEEWLQAVVPYIEPLSEEESHLLVDAWTLYALLHVSTNPASDQTLWYLAGVYAISKQRTKIKSPCVAVACFTLAKELAHLSKPVSLAVLHHGLAYQELKSIVAMGWTIAMALSLVELDIGVGCNKTHPYPTSPSITSFTIDEPTANLLLVHFAFVRLAPRDFILLHPVVNSSTPPETSERITSSSNSLGAFFSMPLYSTKATVELHTFGASAKECYGFQIDGIRTRIHDNAKFASELESICGTDDSMNAECFINSPSYLKAKAVVRMLTNRERGSDFCTGWLLGCEGHLLTNQHCIQSSDDAINTQYEFMAEGMSCTDNCESQGACSSRQFVRGGILIATSKTLDYSLVLLDNIPLGLGFLQFRASGPVLNEKIYIPQYPMGWGKRIAAVKGNQPGVITSVTLSGCAPNQAGYMLDTQPGSSGSPVIAAKDNNVVALHHCGGCPNAGIQSQYIIEDLRRKRALPACAVA